MTSRNRERNSVHDRTHTHLRAIQEGQTHQGSSMGELLNDIKTNTSNINLNVDSLEVNTDTLEAKIQATNDKLDTFSGAGNNNVGEGQVKLQIYNYGRDVSAGNYKPMVVDSDGHLQVDSLSSALPTGASTEAKQDVIEASLTSIETDIESTNTKLDTLQATFDADITRFTTNNIKSHLTQNGDGTGNKAGEILDAINTNTITQNNNFHNKVAFLQPSVDAESSPPSGTTEILLTQDVPVLFKMTNLTTAVGDVEAAITTNTGTLNSVLTTIDTDTGNIDSKLGVISSTTSANNTLQAGILNRLSGNNSGGGTFAGENLQNIADRLFDDNKSVATSVNAINTNTITQNSKIDDTNTKLDTIASRLIDDSNSVAVSNNAINTNTISSLAKLNDINFNLTANNLVLGGGLPSALNSDQLKVSDSTTATKLGTIETDIEATNTKLDSVIGTASSAHSTKGVILMGKVGDLTSDGQHDATGIAQNDAQFIAVDGAGLVGVTGNFITENSIEFSSGNDTSKTQRVVLANDVALPAGSNTIGQVTIGSGNVNIQGNRIDNGANQALRCSASGSLLIDTEASGALITAINAIKTAVESLNTKLSASNTSGHYGNA